MDFDASLAYLHGLGMELRAGAKFDLLQVRALLQALGAPQRRLAAVHIAGTNGKGSTAALIESAARAAGWRTGLYTSPHLERITERIRLGGPGGLAEIAPPAFAAAATRVRRAAQRLQAAGALAHPPSFFEALTALGFLALADAAVELAIVEVGLGGRLDATNVLEARVAVITPIGLDHEAWLGSTLPAIAAEKAGIIHPGLDAVISAPQLPEVGAVLRAACRDAGVKLVETEPGPDTPPTALAGEHQRLNAACARAACLELAASGFAIPPAAVERGFAMVRWPGRLERIACAPEVYLDGAHNPMAAEALARHLEREAAAPVLVFGCMRDKDIAGIARPLFPRARAVVLTACAHPRAASPLEIEAACAGLGTPCLPAAGIAEALARARALAPGAPIYVTGSLYLVGEARALFQTRPIGTRP